MIEPRTGLGSLGGFGSTLQGINFSGKSIHEFAAHVLAHLRRHCRWIPRFKGLGSVHHIHRARKCCLVLLLF